MNANDPKLWWQSRTVWSAAVILVLAILSASGFDVAGDDGEAEAIVTGILAVAAIAGRILARQRIGRNG